MPVKFILYIIISLTTFSSQAFSVSTVAQEEQEKQRPVQSSEISDAALRTFNATESCCSSFKEMDYMPMEYGFFSGKHFKFSKGAPLYHFETGRSYFAAIGLPKYSQPYVIRVKSFSGSWGDPFFYPMLIFLDKDFEVVKSIHSGLIDNRDIHDLLIHVQMDQEISSSKYLIIATSDELRSKTSSFAYSYKDQNGYLNFIHATKKHSPMGKVSVELIDDMSTSSGKEFLSVIQKKDTLIQLKKKQKKLLNWAHYAYKLEGVDDYWSYLLDAIEMGYLAPGIESLLWEHTAIAPSASAEMFFTLLLHKTPSQAHGINTYIHEVPGKFQKKIIKIIAQSDSDEARTALKKLSKIYKFKAPIAKYLKEPLDDPLNEDINYAHEVDICWSAFMATGDQRYLQKIVSKEPEKIEKGFINRLSGKWALGISVKKSLDVYENIYPEVKNFRGRKASQ